MEKTTRNSSFESTSARNNQKENNAMRLADAPDDAFDYNPQRLGLSNDAAPAQMKEGLEEEELQMKKPEEEEVQMKAEEEEELQMKKPKNDTKAKKTSSGGNIQTKMPEEVQTKMENSFGTDFSDVNIHKDSSSAKDMGALAYAQGNDVHFAPGQYNPNSQNGQQLLGHELTHVVQQRQGRVSGSQNKGGANINDDPSLEKEADVMGAKAAKGLNANVSKSLSTNSKQAWAPVVGLLAGLSAADAAAIIGTGIAGAQAVGEVGAAVVNGSSGVQTCQIGNLWMSKTNEKKLEIIIQYKLINEYANMLNDKTTVTEEMINLIRSAVNSKVKLEVEQTLNANQKEMSSKEYIWSDSGDHTADILGTVGAIQFAGVRGSYLKHNCTLSAIADFLFPNLKEDLPYYDSALEVRQFRGGRLEKGPSFELGLNDDLGVNLVGGAPTINYAGNSGHGVFEFSTEWNWDNNTTNGIFGLQIGAQGMPAMLSPKWSGTPDD